MNKNLTHQKDEWQGIWRRTGFLTLLVNTGRGAYNAFFRRYLRRFIRKETRFLELGCGTATLMLSIADEVKEVVGIDISEAALELSREEARKTGVTNSRFEIGDCLNLHYQDEFDIVWSQGLMEHFDKPEKVAREHYKATAPGGMTLISVPYKYSYHALWYKLTRPKPLQFLWPWTDMILLDKKRLLDIGKKITPKARVVFLRPFPLGIAILELPKR